MIWSVVTKEEMEGYKIPPVFHNYQEALGRDKISLAVVDATDDLSFVKRDDIVLLRTASHDLIKTIRNNGIKSTAEASWAYELANDKKKLSEFLAKFSIPVPHQFGIDELNDDTVYFVKPRFGGESFGITERNICRTKVEAVSMKAKIREETSQDVVIEEFIEGVDCTVACYYKDGEIRTHAIEVECDTKGGIQTHSGKFDYKEFCVPMKGDSCRHIKKIAKDAFNLLGLKHHARIDFRMSKDGEVYLIDVNLLPGLGPIAHYSKCLLLTDNMSYRDSLMTIIDSAT